MLSKSFREMCKGRWREFLREPSAFFWVMFMPLLWMVVLGFAFSKPRLDRFGVAVQGAKDLPQWARGLKNETEFDLYKVSAKHRKDTERLFKSGHVVLLVELDDRQIRYVFDPVNPQGVQARRRVDEIFQQAAGRTNPLPTIDGDIAVTGGRYVDFLVPGLLGLSIMTSSLFGVGMTLVSNRKENLLKRYLATPMRKSEFLLSHVVGRVMVLVFEFAVVVGAAWLIFTHQVAGNFLLYFAFSALGAAAFTAIALLAASRTKSIPAIGGMLNLITLPMMMVSGVFFSKQNLPDWLVALANYLPLTVLNDGLRKIALESAGMEALCFEGAVLGVYLIIGTIAAKMLFRWY